MKYILGKKIEMTQRFLADGRRVPVTRISAAPNRVTQVKTQDRDGYTAIQIGLPGRTKLTKSLIYIYTIMSINLYKMEQEILHYPNLKTVLMVEKVLKEAELTLTREELKKRLPTQIMHQTLNVVLEYLEERGLIIDGHKGILWTHNDSPKLRHAIARGTEI